MGMNETLLKSLKTMKGKGALLLLLLAGLLLLLLGGRTPEEEERFDSEAYRTALTAEVAALCREVGGVGEVSVLLTLEAGECFVYAEDGDGYVTVGGEGLLLERRPPRVLGVAVVCTGGEDPAVRERLTGLLSAALGVGTHKVQIAEKK